MSKLNRLPQTESKSEPDGWEQTSWLSRLTFASTERLVHGEFPNQGVELLHVARQVLPREPRVRVGRRP